MIMGPVNLYRNKLLYTRYLHDYTLHLPMIIQPNLK